MIHHLNDRLFRLFLDRVYFCCLYVNNCGIVGKFFLFCTQRHLKDKFPLLSERYQSGFLLSRLVKSCCSDFLCEERAREVEQFFTEHPLPGSERNVAQAVETIRLNTAWLGRDQTDIANFFKQI